MRNGIVTVGIGSWHPKGVERLVKSLKDVNFQGDIVTFDKWYPKGSPAHQVIPYAFKAYAMDEMRNSGYENVLWLDSSFWAIDTPQPIFDLIETYGYMFQFASHCIGNWASDSCLKHFKMTRDEAMKKPMFLAGGFGLNFKHPKGNAFLDRWIANVEQFKGPWDNQDHKISKDERCLGHRHDMTVGSIIADELGMVMLPDNTFMSYNQWYQNYKKNNRNLEDISLVSFLLEGM